MSKKDLNKVIIKNIAKERSCWDCSRLNDNEARHVKWCNKKDRMPKEEMCQWWKKQLTEKQ